MKSKLIAMVMGLLVLGSVARANDFQALGWGEGVANQATHCWTLTYKDLTESTTNISQVISNAIEADTYVEFSHMQLVQAFDKGTTNYTQSTKIGVGDPGSSNRFMNATEIAADGTEVWLALGKGGTVTSTSTPTLSTTAINGTNVVTNLTVATTSTLAAGARAGVLYTVATNLTVQFDPDDTPESLADNTKGEVRLYYRIYTAGRQ